MRPTFRAAFYGALLLIAIIAVAKLPAFSRGPLDSAAGPRQIEWPLHANSQEIVHLAVPGNLIGPGSRGGFEFAKLDPESAGNNAAIRAAMMFFVLWPDMKGRESENENEFEVRGGGRTLMVEIDSSATGNPDGPRSNALVFRHQLALEYLEKVCVPTGRPVPDNMQCTIHQPEIVRNVFGLKLLGRDYVAFPIDRDSVGSAIDLLEEDDPHGNILTLITCHPDGLNYPTQFSPHCAQSFIDPRLNAMVEVQYSKRYLSDWREIRAKTSVLIEGFVARGVKDSK